MIFDPGYEHCCYFMVWDSLLINGAVIFIESTVNSNAVHMYVIRWQFQSIRCAGNNVDRVIKVLLGFCLFCLTVSNRHVTVIACDAK